jgi:hypothetical protein
MEYTSNLDTHLKLALRAQSRFAEVNMSNNHYLLTDDTGVDPMGARRISNKRTLATLPGIRDELTQSLLKLADGGGEIDVLKVQADVLAELLESTALKYLLSLNDAVRIKETRSRDAAITFGVLFDKARLLRGEPTAIYSHQDEKKLDEMGALILAEMRRRGIPIEGISALESTVAEAKR